MPHILIAESLDLETLESIAIREGLGLHYQHSVPAIDKGNTIHLSYQPDITPQEIEENLKAYHGLIVRPKEVTGKAIASAPHLRLIIRGGAGVNSIDLTTATKQNVIVENTPGENSVSTAEYTFALLMELAADRQIFRSAVDSRKQKPDIPENYAGKELAGQTIAIIGLGNVGQALAKRCLAFDMRVIGYSRRHRSLDIPQFLTLEALLAQEPDVISLHLPLNPETQGIINADIFNHMRHGTILLNTARPQLVDQVAFAKALEGGILKSFAIDGDLDLITPFIQADPMGKGIITHHIADSTKQAQKKITRQVIKQLIAFFHDGKIINQVNPK